MDANTSRQLAEKFRRMAKRQLEGHADRPDETRILAYAKGVSMGGAMAFECAADLLEATLRHGKVPEGLEK